jgi:hypothetical protein
MRRNTIRRLQLIFVAPLAASLAGCPKDKPPATPPSNGGGGTTTVDQTEKLPDLITLPPHDLSIQYVTLASGQKQRQLRLSNTVRNIGKGPLHMLGLKASDPKPWDTNHLPLIPAPFDPNAPTVHDDGSGASVDQDAKGYQVIEVEERINGKFSRWVPKYYYGPVGNMFFHAQHNHIHFAGFAKYVILNENMIPQSGIQPGRKVSFCIEDFSHWSNGSIEGEPTSGRFGCSMEQGISPGYEDTYSAGIEGQFIDITSLPDGKYYAYTAATRDFKETDVKNNDSATLFEIHGDTITVKEELDNAKLQARAAQIQHDLGLADPLLPPPNPNPPPAPTPTTTTTSTPPAPSPAPTTTTSTPRTTSTHASTPSTGLTGAVPH